MRLRHSLRLDAIAGFTVAMVAIPQGMAYAAIAGAGPINGLYCAIFPAAVGALFGSSGHLVTGPTNATAIVTANVLAPYAHRTTYLEYVFALAVLSGVIKLLLGVFRLGWVIRYVADSVLTGFLTGAAILIILSQISSLFGLPRASGGDTISIVSNTVANLSRANPHVFVVSLATIGLLVVIKRVARRWPAELLAIAVVGVAVRLLGWRQYGVQLVSDLGRLDNPSLVPHLPAVALADWYVLLPSAGAVALFSLVEAMSIAKAVAATTGETLNPSREFVGQGLASLVGGFFQSIPSSGSLARTAINYSSGGRTRLAAVISGIVVLLVLLGAGGLLSYIPVASLAGVVVVSAYGLINRRRISLVWQSNAANRLVMGSTFLATLLLPLHVAIYLGAGLSIVVYVLESSKLHITYLMRTPQGAFAEHSLADILHAPPSITIVNVEGSLSFGAAEDLESHVKDLVRAGVKVIILRVRRMHLLGSEGVAGLERIVGQTRRAGAHVLICGVQADLEAALRAAGIADLLGDEAIYRASDVLFESTQQALMRAEEIVLAERAHGD